MRLDIDSDFFGLVLARYICLGVLKDGLDVSLILGVLPLHGRILMKMAGGRVCWTGADHRADQGFVTSAC